MNLEPPVLIDVAPAAACTRKPIGLQFLKPIGFPLWRQ